LDQQIDVFRERMQRMTGDSSVEQFTNPEKREELVQSFLLRSQFAGISNAAAGSAAV
ncbi:MAG: 4-hydroxybutyrate dehydrogenase, partial [Desulfuromonadales bacterium]|nr:4-hydroxybutyrate dehydrogenase [Desulfuromonadales bacterium]